MAVLVANIHSVYAGRAKRHSPAIPVGLRRINTFGDLEAFGQIAGSAARQDTLKSREFRPLRPMMSTRIE